VLGAMVFMVAMRLIDFAELRNILAESPQEYALAVMTAVVVVLVGVEEGIVLAMVVSLMRVVRHDYHPHSGVLQLNPDGSWNLVPAAADVETQTGLVLYRFGAELFYANAGRFLEEVLLVVEPIPSVVKWVVVDAEAMTHLDYTAAQILKRLKENLNKAGVELAFARVPWDLKSDFNRHHVTEAVGAGRLFNRLHDAIAAFEKSEKPPGQNAG
jgi:MFS superfamily sulfate permease-like transporter